MRHRILVWTLIVAVLASSPAAAGMRGIIQTFPSSSGMGNGTINYDAGYIEATATGTADMRRMVNSPQAEMVARRTARHLAYEVLAEIVGKIQIDGKTLYQNAMLEMDALKIETHAVIRGATIQSDEVEWVRDRRTKEEVPMATATVRLYLNGDEGLGHLIDKHLPPQGGFQAAPQAQIAQPVRHAVPPPATVPAPAPAPAVVRPPVAPPQPAPVPQVAQVAQDTGRETPPAAPRDTATQQYAAAVAAQTPQAAPERTEQAPQAAAPRAAATQQYAAAVVAQAPPVAAESPEQAPPAAAETVATTAYGWLAIDMTGADPGYRPAYRIYVRDDGENLIYGPQVPRASVTREGRGMVRYATTLEEAGKLFPEAQGSPLVVPALGVPAAGEVVIAADQARAIQQAEAGQAFLREARVVLLLGE